MLKIEVKYLDANRKKIGGKWKPLIMFILFQGPRRFNKLKQLLPGVSGNMLSMTLKQMELNGLVKKIEFRYHLTDESKTIVSLLNELRKIVEKLP